MIPVYGPDKGKWAGKLNQQAAQVETDQVFSTGDIHPKYPKLRFLSYRNEKRSRLIFPNGKKIPKDHHRYLAPTIIKTQRWITVEDLEEDIVKRRENQRVKKGYYKKENTARREQMLDQKSLQVKDTGFKTYDLHPYVKGIIFQSYRSKGGMQRWARGDESSRGHQSRARLLCESLQTNKPIGYWHRGNPHPKNKKYVFTRYTSHDPRWSSESVLVNGHLYRKYNPEQWLLIGSKSAPDIISRKESLFKKRNDHLQTGMPLRTFSQGDTHPENSKYVFKCYRYKGKTNIEHWITHAIHGRNKRWDNKVNRQRKIDKNKALIEFYKETKYPKYLWHEGEFAFEKDFQSAIEHYLVKKLKLEIIHEMDTGNGRVDIHIPSINLNIEVKLTSDTWNIDKVAEQKSRYDKVAETIIVSLDGKPDGWVTPRELFKIINKHRNKEENNERRLQEADECTQGTGIRSGHAKQ